MTDTYKKLYRSRTNRMFSGLLAGIGEYVGIDPTLVRVVLALTSLFIHPLIIAYLVMMLIVPEEPLPAGSTVVDVIQPQ